MNNEHEWVVFIAVQYSISFYVFGYIHGRNKAEDVAAGRRRWWVIRHYWEKIKS